MAAMFGGTPDPMSMLLGIMGTPHGQKAALDIASTLAMPAKRAAAMTGYLPEGYRWQTPEEESKWMEDAALGFAGSVTPKVPPLMGATRGVTDAVAASSPYQGIRAYHGSPYDFNRFDMSKIGTGEGAQAYGHGLYFAEKEGVAKAYRSNLSQAYVTSNKGLVPHGEMHGELAEAARKAANLHPDQARKVANYVLDGVEVYGSPQAYLKQFEFPGGHFGDAYRAAAHRAQELSIAPNKGKMYEVNIRAKPEEFLDWDKPLSQQAQNVQGALSKFGFRANPEGMRKFDDELLAQLNGAPMRPLPKQPHDPAGEFMYRNIPMATPRLRDEGIPGIRYLDQGSRAAGDGSRNYVLFRDDIIDILRKYGVFGAPPMFGKKPDEQ